MWKCSNTDSEDVINLQFFPNNFCHKTDTVFMYTKLELNFEYSFD